MKRADIPQLEGWLTLPQAADKLGLTRQGVHRLISLESLTTIRRLGDTIKPIYVISETEISKMVKDREAKLAQTKELVG